MRADKRSIKAIALVEGEEQFWFEGKSDGDNKVKVEIQGAFLRDLPWHRGAQQHARQK